jgi:hypothetical protein
MYKNNVFSFKNVNPFEKKFEFVIENHFNNHSMENFNTDT